jgi:hypothetical protein
MFIACGGWLALRKLQCCRFSAELTLIKADYGALLMSCV